MSFGSNEFEPVVQSIRIAASPAAVWDVLVDPQAGQTWRGADFKTDWRVGDPFEIDAVIGAKRHRDKGRVLEFAPRSLLKYAYWSRISGLPDAPRNYAVIAMRLLPDGEVTILTIEHQAPPSPVRRGRGWEIGPESGRKHAESYWRMTLPILKRVAEAGDSNPFPDEGPSDDR